MIPDIGCSWERYLSLLVSAHGGWTALTQTLVRRAGPDAGLPVDPGSIERALRRLRTKGNAPGGQYGVWLIRHFGVPTPLEETARWMGQYHSRFSDLPVSLRETQLWLWDRPPISESPAAAWIHLGLASVALRRNDFEAARARLSAVTSPSPLARIEADLLAGRLAFGLDRAAILASVGKQVEALPPSEDRDCYYARWADQHAYHLIHTENRLPEAKTVYSSIPSDTPALFAQFRRHHGLAYCHWKLDDNPTAVHHATLAIQHAGDAGLLRFRVMALQLLAHISPDNAPTLRHRADQIATTLEHADLT